MNDNEPGWLVACLCAAWCRTCDDYRTTFEALARDIGVRAQFRWVDIEDDEAALGDLDIVDFPTLLVADGDTIHFLGPVLPYAAAARQLIERAMRRELATPRDRVHEGLAARLRALRG
ncbi:thioredoxin domain-containing protein [Piscinibacter defluvii]|uniref:thioredoxin domain-containing protein n=1 Tax=Piscinibacter defluvii TaxID=1796922 RepID=UPI000FDD7CFB|nr:thioredoxin domain-containing protein [Piscinibacter defluvii]